MPARSPCPSGRAAPIVRKNSARSGLVSRYEILRWVARPLEIHPFPLPAHRPRGARGREVGPGAPDVHVRAAATRFRDWTSRHDSGIVEPMLPIVAIALLLALTP